MSKGLLLKRPIVFFFFCLFLMNKTEFLPLSLLGNIYLTDKSEYENPKSKFWNSTVSLFMLSDVTETLYTAFCLSRLAHTLAVFLFSIWLLYISIFCAVVVVFPLALILQLVLRPAVYQLCSGWHNPTSGTFPPHITDLVQFLANIKQIGTVRIK